jgi:hypothetical protein
MGSLKSLSLETITDHAVGHVLHVGKTDGALGTGSRRQGNLFGRSDMAGNAITPLCRHL